MGRFLGRRGSKMIWSDFPIQVQVDKTSTWKPTWTGRPDSAFQVVASRWGPDSKNRFRSKLGSDLTWTHQIDPDPIQFLTNGEQHVNYIYKFKNIFKILGRDPLKKNSAAHTLAT